MPLTLECAGECGHEVKLSKERFLQLVRENKKPLCEQCRRYLKPPSARVSQLRKGAAFKDYVLVRSGSSGAGADRPLAKCRVSKVAPES